MKASQQYRSSTTWFYWVAAYSIINAILIMINASIYLLGGLGITMLANYMFGFNFTGQIISGIFTLVASGVFALIGYLANKGLSWAFFLGLALYLIDALILLVFAPDIVGLIFHGYVIVALLMGYFKR
jgi:hypothetical protein